MRPNVPPWLLAQGPGLWPAAVRLQRGEGGPRRSAPQCGARPGSLRGREPGEPGGIPKRVARVAEAIGPPSTAMGAVARSALVPACRDGVAPARCSAGAVGAGQPRRGLLADPAHVQGGVVHGGEFCSVAAP
jgi:hypothetical protein